MTSDELTRLFNQARNHPGRRGHPVAQAVEARTTYTMFTVTAYGGDTPCKCATCPKVIQPHMVLIILHTPLKANTYICTDCAFVHARNIAKVLLDAFIAEVKK